MKEEIIGYLFTLKKRMQYKEQDDNEKYEYVVFGYYDGLKITSVKKWYDFRPRGIEKLNGVKTLNDPFIDQYTIKTIIPPNYADLIAQGVNYDIWSEKKGKGKNNFPYVAMVSIHLSESFLKEVKDIPQMSQLLVERINVVADKENIAMETLNCGVFPSLGFSDIVIAFMIDNFVSVSKIVNGLRIWIRNKKIVISSCYTVCGINCLYKGQVNKKEDNSYTLSIKVSLKEGISTKKFIGELGEKLGEKLFGNCMCQERQECISEIITDINHSCSTFGNVDCLISPRKYINGYLLQFLKDGIFNVSSKLYQNYISDIRTTIGIFETGPLKYNKEDYNDILDIELKALTEKRYAKKTEFGKFISVLESKVEELNYPIRSIRALQGMLKNFENIAYTTHGFDVRNSIEPIFGRFFKYVEKIVKENDLININCAFDLIDVFRDNIGDYLMDLIRSDKPFIEGNMLVHPSIGSATKLLFAYSVVLNEISSALIKSEEDDNIYFVVMSGGTDKIISLDLFDFYEESQLNKPVFVTIPEMALYDIQGTLFRLLHECMHFCGKRRRKKRYDLMRRCISDFMAFQLSDIVFDCDEKLKQILPDINGFLSKKEIEGVKCNLEKELIIIRNEVRGELFELFNNMEHYKIIEASRDSRKYYFENLVRELDSTKCRKAGVFNSDFFARNFIAQSSLELMDKIYSCILKYQLVWAEKLNAVLEKEGIAYFYPYINSKKIQILLENRTDKDAYIDGLIELYFKCFFEDAGTVDYVNDLGIYTYLQVFNLLKTALSEGYSDSCAAKLLGMSVEDFLLAFIYDKMLLDKAMPLNLENALRMGANLKIVFGIEVIDKRLKNALKTRAKSWECYGFIYNNVDEYIKRLTKLLEWYNSKPCQIFAPYIEDYLKECLRKNSVDSFDCIKEIYSYCNIQNNNLFRTIEFLFEKWKSLSE